MYRNFKYSGFPFEDIFLGTLDTYTKKINPPSAVLGRGVHVWNYLASNIIINTTLADFKNKSKIFIMSNKFN